MHRLGPLGARTASTVSTVRLPVAQVHVGEYRGRADVAHRIGGGDERQRRHDDFVARARSVDHDEREMQAGRAGADGDAVRGTDLGRERPLRTARRGVPARPSRSGPPRSSRVISGANRGPGNVRSFEMRGQDLPRSDGRVMGSHELGWKVVKHVKSNAIVYARPGHIVAVGAGQMSRARCQYRRQNPICRSPAASSLLTRFSRFRTVSSAPRITALRRLFSRGGQ